MGELVVVMTPPTFLVGVQGQTVILLLMVGFLKGPMGKMQQHFVVAAAEVQAVGLWLLKMAVVAVMALLLVEVAAVARRTRLVFLELAVMAATDVAV